MKLYVIRHGETDWNVEKRFQGTADISLNEKGVELARIVGENMMDIPFDFAISSPLRRAVETAQLALGGREIPIYPDERVGEMSFGDWEGLHYYEGSTEIPADFMHNFFFDTDNYVAPPNGESFEQVIERTGDLYKELISNEEYENAHILISSHGASSRAFLQGVFQDGNIWQGGVPKNCAVTIVEVEKGQVKSVELDHIFY